MFCEKLHCINCHFLTRKDNFKNVNEPPIHSLTQEERENIKKEDYTWIKDFTSLQCAYGVWNEGYQFDKSRRHGILTKLKRNNFCFYFKYHPGMLNEPAKILQKREEENKKAKTDRNHTKVGLWVAAIALAMNVIFEIYKYYKHVDYCQDKKESVRLIGK